jgi:Tfp pilus assembly protein PilN
MRAVNLLPNDLRGAAPAAAPSSRPERERVEGIGAYVLLGALALCVAMLAVYVMASNTVKQKQADLNGIAAQASAAEKAAAELKPYADFEAMAKARVETVRDLAAARFDWEQALRDLSRAVPGNIKLQSLNGDMGLPGTTGSNGDPLRGSIQAPAISLAGCAPSQSAVARLMARLRAVDGVTRVSLSKSEKGDGETETACVETNNPPQFSAVVFFERSAALKQFAPPTADAATGPSVPVPSAVDSTAPAAGGSTAAAGSGTTGAGAGNSAQAQAGDAASTTTPSTPGAVAP